MKHKRVEAIKDLPTLAETPMVKREVYIPYNTTITLHILI